MNSLKMSAVKYSQDPLLFDLNLGWIVEQLEDSCLLMYSNTCKAL